MGLPGIGDAAAEVLHRTFGYNSFRGQQQEIIEHVCAGGDAIALMPTGSGKSLCYQIPALVREGTGVVISPLAAEGVVTERAVQHLGRRVTDSGQAHAAILRAATDTQSPNRCRK